MTKLIFDWDKKQIPPKSRKAPYGWKIDSWSTDPETGRHNVFKVDYELVPFIEKACQSIADGNSLRDASNWLTVATGKPLSHTALNTLYHSIVLNHEDTHRKEKLETWRKPTTREEKRKRKLVERKAAARRAITINKKKLTRLESPTTDGNSLPPLLDGVPLESFDPEATVIFRPNEGPQTEFLMASEQEVLYGGAAGGGKSFALLADPMRYFDHPKFNGLLIRRTNDELRDLIRESQALYPKAFPGAKFQAQQSTWTFPSGAKLWLSYLERDDDVLRYQGQAFTWIGVDELTQYATPYAWNYLRSRLRTTAKDLPVSQRGTTNPGGPGHGWVKKMFIDPSPENTSFVARDLDTNTPLVYPVGHPKEGRPLFKRRFIPAKLADNPYLSEDGQYEATLLSLPEHLRRQLLDGDWTVAQGAAFPEFRTSVHVREPFKLDPNWRRFRSCDYGYSSYSAVLWFAINPDGQLIVYRELYVTKHTGKDLAQKILEYEKGDRISYGIMDSSTFHTRGNSGPVLSEEMAGEGVRFRPSDRGHGSRIAGRNRLHELLKVDDRGEPGIIFFNNCRQTISDLQVIPTDPKGGEDIDDRYASDHTYDALRYGIMSRPRPNSQMEDWGTTPSTRQPFDPVFGY